MSKREYHKVNAGLFLLAENRIVKDGQLSFDIHFMEKLLDYLFVFREEITDIITATIGEDWAINFVQTDMLAPHFFVDIYLDNPIHFNVVRQIVGERLGSDIKFDYFLRGNVDLYIGTQ